MDLKYCRRCGSPLAKTGDTHRFVCQNDHVIYANAVPSVGVFFIEPNGDVLLSRRGIEPYKGYLDCFGGFVDGKEAYDEALIRELNEEMGLEPDDYEPPRYLTSVYGDYPFKGESIPLLGALFWTRLTGKRVPRASDDVAEIVRLPLSSLNPQGICTNETIRGIFELKSLHKRNMLD